MKPKNIVILGGTRFIGFLMVSKLINEGHNVTVFNRQLSIPPEPFPDITNFVKGDRNCSNHFENIFTNSYDVIIDISGFTTRHVEPIVRKYTSKIGHYIFISTTAVFKEPFSNPITEESPRVFLKNTYGGDKALVEDLLLNNKKELSVTIFRPAGGGGVFGPYEHNLLGLIFYRIINNLPILVGKNSNVLTQQLFVFDLIRAVSLSMGNSIAFGKNYNIVGDEALTLIEYIELCGEICFKKPIIKYIEAISQYNELDFVKKKRHVNFYAEWPEKDIIYDNSLIKKDLNVKFTGLEESLRTTYSWLTINPKDLNYFSLRAEQFVLYNLSVPIYYITVYKIIDYLNKFIVILKTKLKKYNLIQKNVYRFRNFKATRSK